MDSKMVPGEWWLDLGALVLGNGATRFLLWAPNIANVELYLFPGEGKNEYSLKMEKQQNGYHSLIAENIGSSTRYMYVLPESRTKKADPVSRYQPEGIHGPSEVVDGKSFKWTDRGWKGIDTEDLIIYELHVGTFTKDGTFDAILPYIDYLRGDLGVTAVEIMPIAQFPGDRNWGYDGVFLFAPQNSYGGPESLKRLIDSCHSKGLAVILDVVYNHLGPEGNFLSDFAPYFSNKYHTPWGPSANYDERGSDEVRRFVVSNALYWVAEYHFDGLRLDAVHAIFDNSPKNILEEIKDSVERESTILQRKVNVIAESDLNDPKIVLPKDRCGYGLDSQWSDDFHHSVHAYFTGERFGYYQDYGSIEDIAKALSSGFVYDGKYSRFRGKRHGGSSKDVPGERFVVCLQNHDQIGNRPDGSRLSVLLEKEMNQLKVAAGLLLLSPYVPLLFMGEEFGETAPFYYFISHTDAKLVEAVREGRKKEFESNRWGRLYVDPQSEETFQKSKINLEKSRDSFNRDLFSYYRELILLRKENSVLRSLKKENMIVGWDRKDKLIVIHRSALEQQLVLAYNLGPTQAKISKDMFETAGVWKKIHDSSDSSDMRSQVTTPDEPVTLPPYTLAIFSKEI